MLTRAAVLAHPGLDGVVITDVHLDEPRGHEVLVRVAASGLCHSDLHVINGTLPAAGQRILGHEMSGVVEAVGDRVATVAPGDHVVACLAMACGACRRCALGQQNMCERRPALWSRPPEETPRAVDGQQRRLSAGSGIGGLAEHALVDERGLVAIPRDMPLGPAALLGCAVLTGTGAALRTAAVTPDSTVAVIGCGGVGVSIIQAARIAGARQIIAVDRAADKLEHAKVFGATATVRSGAGAAHVDGVRALTNGDGVDHAFEAVGTPRTVEDALAMLAPRGIATIVGVFADGVDIAVPARAMLTRETRLQGSYMGSSNPARDIPALCELYRSGRLMLDEMVDPRLGLDDVRHGFELLATGAALRPLVVFT